MKTPNLMHQHTVPIDTLARDEDLGRAGVGELAGGVDGVDGTAGAGAPAEAPADDAALREGTRLAGYEIIDVIGRGGFGIVYLAFDNLLERHIAIKEYLPASLGVRAPLSPYVTPRSHRSREAFGAGLRSFINEARLLARFNHPSLVKVLRFWEANGTAYMAMPYCQGPTLADELAALGRSPDEDELRRLLRPLLDGLAAMHAVNCFHRDVAPDNILLTDDGPMLLDFGAARRVIGNLTNDLSAVVKPGFSPIEQYAEDPSLKQGPWTDLYALAAVAYAAVTGKPPQPSVDRLKDDRLKPLSEVARGRFSPALLAAIDGALAVRPADRPKNVAGFLARLDGEAAGPGAVDAPREARFQMALSQDGRREPAFDLAVPQSLESPVDPALLDAEFTPTFEFADAPLPLQVTPLLGAGVVKPAPAPALAHAAAPTIARESAASVSASASASVPASKPYRASTSTSTPIGASAVESKSESEFEVEAGAAPPTEPPPAAAPVGAIVAVDTGAAAEALPSWAREKPRRWRTPLYVLLGMSFVLMLAAIGYGLGSTTPPPMVSKLQPTAPARSTPAPKPAPPAAPSVPLAATPAPAATQPIRIPTSPAAVPPAHASASPMPAPARPPAPAPPAAAHTQASASAPSATSPKPSHDGARSTSVAPNHAATAAPLAGDDSHGNSPAIAAVPAAPAAPSHGAAPPPPGRPEHVAQAGPARGAANRARCTEILQSASLGPLNAGETAFLKRECHR
ncbi:MULTISPECIES: serine/threonine-protein kinase [unclassified Variovorax]|uniref:serine/threonine-protein kinase n=1 Tax=unclassified Variovorax TaxID=663243 RepID=UPI001BD23B1F|nr:MULTISPECIES: serine/threonine-protein kinase [unclassified Variovorax]